MEALPKLPTKDFSKTEPLKNPVFKETAETKKNEPLMSKSTMR